MLTKIIGGVTLAAAAYALKEYCEEEGCPWDDNTSSSSSRDDEDVSVKNGAVAKSFYKYKKQIYKTSMKEYQAYLEKYELSDAIVSTNVKLQKEKFTDDELDGDAEMYIEQISTTLEILSHNMRLAIDEANAEETLEDTTKEKIRKYAESIYALAHVQLFGLFLTVNKTEILEALVKGMALTTQKQVLHVDLAS